MGKLLIDVPVIHPTAMAHRERATVAFGGSAPMVNTKDAKYLALARKLGAEVVPAVFETFGAITQPALDLFKRIANFAKTHTNLWTWNEVYTGLVTDTSHALQRGNALILTKDSAAY